MLAAGNGDGAGDDSDGDGADDDSDGDGVAGADASLDANIEEFEVGASKGEAVSAEDTDVDVLVEGVAGVLAHRAEEDIGVFWARPAAGVEEETDAEHGRQTWHAEDVGAGANQACETAT